MGRFLVLKNFPILRGGVINVLVLEVSQNDFLLHDEASKKKKGANKANAHAQIEAGNLEHLTRFMNINK